MKIVAISSLVVLLFLLAVILPSASAYYDANMGFSITEPSGWEKTNESSVMVIFTHPENTALIAVITGKTDMSLMDFYYSQVPGYENRYENYAFQNSGNRTVGNLQGYAFEFTSTGVRSNLYSEVVFLIENGRFFEIQFTKSDDFSNDATFEASLQTFKVIDTSTPTPPITPIPSPTPSGSSGLQLSPSSVVAVAIVIGLIVLVVGIGVGLSRRKRSIRKTEGQISPASQDSITPSGALSNRHLCDR